MINWLISLMANALLRLRYRIRLRGAKAVTARGKRGILFLPNHPALIDPIIVLATLWGRFRPRSLGDKDQIARPVIRRLARRMGVRPIPDIARYGPDARDEVQRVIGRCIEDLRAGGNVLLYPAGHLQHSRLEDLRGNSAVERILAELPDVRVVLVRTRGLWGSGFSLASGRVPSVGRVLRKGARALLASGVFFAPRRRVRIELAEPDDLPRDAGREELNAALEAFYNQDAPPNTYVPYSLWERGGVRELGEPDLGAAGGDVSAVPQEIRRRVAEFLATLSGRAAVADDEHLARDLGLDSLARAEVVVWLSAQFGAGATDVDSLQSVADVMLAAAGESVSSRPVEIVPPPGRWFAGSSDTSRIAPPVGETIAEAFLHQARKDPGRIVVADQRGGAKTYRDMVTAVFALRPHVERLDGECIGIMLPAGVTAAAAYLAVMFAGKTPVMVNWTLGPRNLHHCLELTGVRHILTARALLTRLEAQGVELGSVAERCVHLEDVARRIGPGAKLAAAARARFRPGTLAKAAISPTAAILFTSGSESVPKAVPLSHANILANIRDVLQVAHLTVGDRMLGLLPPFHSFGLTVLLAAPLTAGIPVVYHPDPTESWALAAVIEAYRATLLLGTPTFLGGIVRSAKPGQLDSLRLAVTGAEKCPQRTYEAIARTCPNAVVLEGYGATECSPIISVNDIEAPKPFTIGKVLPSLDHVIVGVESGARVTVGETGMLLVRGPSVFDGYRNYDGPPPFAELDGRQWYRTGDLVSEDADGVLTFRGRLKRFVKIAGEMISLPAIESALEPHYLTDADEGPVLAVQALEQEARPQLILFITRNADRDAVNRQIRAAGLSALHNIARVEPLDEIPTLGTGKTDYRALKRRLEQVEGVP